MIYALTFGLLGIGVLFDLFTIPTQVREANTNIAREVGALTGETQSMVPTTAPRQYSKGTQVVHVAILVILGLVVFGVVNSITSGF